AYKSQRLATIELNVPIEISFDDCKLSMPEVEDVGKFFKTLQFKTLVARLPKALTSLSGSEGDRNLEESLMERISGVKVDNSEPIKSTNGDGLKGESSASMPIVAPKTYFDGPPEPRLITTQAQLDELIQELEKVSILSVDLETTGVESLDTRIVGWALAWGDGVARDENGRITKKAQDDNSRIETAYIPVSHNIISHIPQLDPELVVKALKPILENESIGKIAQNAKFESNVLSLVGIDFKPLAFDPMLASYIVDPDQKHGLKDQCERLLGYSMVRISEIIGKGRKQITMDLAPIEKVAPYAADDARVALALAAYYAEILDEEQSSLLYDMELPVERVLAKMEQTGVKLDLDFMSKLSKELSEEIARVEKEIFDIAGYTFNINSTQQLQRLLFTELGMETKSRTKTGFSTDASVLEALLGSHPIIQKILEYRHLSKLLSTYVDALPKQVSERDKRLHGEFNQTVASTGRLSSSNPNLQNIP
ncbi:MAG: hypothetical protein K8F91_05415, partial [Candidatus Obscuribacterales bacterium]|nr:hypothetical protein [Candidatus Obscuribacterales bacterium]